MSIEEIENAIMNTIEKGLDFLEMIIDAIIEKINNLMGKIGRKDNG